MKTYLPKIATIATVAFAAALCAAQQISVTINDQPVQFHETQPQFINGRVLVPLRGLFEQMGASVRWNEVNQSVMAQKGNKIIRLQIGSKTARVDDQKVSLDVPALIIDGSTMVPIRFVSESLGAQVGWNESSQLVSIQTNDGDYSVQATRSEESSRAEKIQHVQNDVWREGTVIPVSLNTALSSDQSRSGDAFSAAVDSQRGVYARFPRGTRIVGHVVSAKQRSGKEPGVLELAFDAIRTPNGNSYPIQASLSGLDSKSVDQNGEGTLTSKGSKDRTNVFAGIGAGAGLIVGLTSHRPLEDAAIGGILGFIAGEIEKNQNKSRDVQLSKGTQFGIRLDRDFSLPN